MENKNEKLGAVYLEVEVLDKVRFNELIKGMSVNMVNVDGLRYIESFYDGIDVVWYHTNNTEPNSKLITLDELERLISDLPEKEQQPTHFAISPDDYYEYQDLKKLKETLKKLLK